MKTITIRMEDELHKELKRQMVEEEKTIQDHIVDLIETDINKKKMIKNKTI